VKFGGLLVYRRPCTFSSSLKALVPWVDCLQRGMTMSLSLFIQTPWVIRKQLDVGSVVNKDLSFKAKAKDLTSEHVQGPL